METTEVKSKTPRAPRAKKAPAKAVAEAKVEVAAPTGEYIYGLGRRKTSIAKVRLFKKGTGQITINGRPLNEYFGPLELRNLITDTLNTVGLIAGADVSAEAEGGGVRGQAEAVRLGLSRALIELNPVWRKTLKKLGNLTRDPRAKERKKFGLKKARRAPQWSKR
jgi:small subunit ribosomal protein S9